MAQPKNGGSASRLGFWWPHERGFGCSSAAGDGAELSAAASDGETWDKGQCPGCMLPSWVLGCLGAQISNAGKLRDLDLGCSGAPISDLGCWEVRMLGFRMLRSRLFGFLEAQILDAWMLGSSDLGSQMLRSRIFGFLEAQMLRSQMLGCWEAQISDLRRSDLSSRMLRCRAEVGHLWEGESKTSFACKRKITRGFPLHRQPGWLTPSQAAGMGRMRPPQPPPAWQQGGTEGSWVLGCCRQRPWAGEPIGRWGSL